MRLLLPPMLAVLLPSALLAGCEEGSAPSPQPTTTAQLRAGFPERGVADTIVVNAVERLPLREAELVAPDGTTTPASSVQANDNPTTRTGQWGAGDPWQNAVSSLGGQAAVAIPNAEAGAALRSEAQLLAVVSSADITLPDPVAYRRDWQQYRIHLTFGTPPATVETRDIPAPEPPPEPAAPPQ